MTSYSADNAVVNYGRKNWVYQKLQEKHKDLLKANCFCQVLHNAGKFALKDVDSKFDIETLANKIYTQFSSSTVRNRELIDCYDFFELEYIKPFKNVPTRWLSLSDCVTHITKAWPALKQYFISIGKDQFL